MGPVLEWMQVPWIQTGIGLILILLIALLCWRLASTLLRRILLGLVSRSRTQIDDAIFGSGAYDRLVLLVPLAIVSIGLDLLPHLHAQAGLVLNRLLVAGMLLVGTSVGIALLSAANTIYSCMDCARQRPIKGYVQMVQIFVTVIGIILAIATAIDQSPWALLTGIGTLTAVLLLVFKDTILGLVSSMQLAGNDVVRVGDWIEMPAYGADGDVIDIALHTVKVRNFDKTIVTIPTYKLAEGAIRNWRGMQESGGRRIKRNLYIDLNSVAFLTDDEIARLRKLRLLTSYLDDKLAQLAADKTQHPDPEGLPANARRLTNIGTFRAYCAAYLRAHPQVHHEGFTFLVRQLEPTPQGLPLQIYVFTTTTVWADYEAIQADIFDHLLAIAPEFQLRLYQQPAGYDFRLGFSQS